MAMWPHGVVTGFAFKVDWEVNEQAKIIVNRCSSGSNSYIQAWHKHAALEFHTGYVDA